MAKLHEHAERDRDRVFACDTEVKDLNIVKQSPRVHGSVVCFSIYCGEDVNFREDPEKPRMTHLWVDTGNEAPCECTVISLL